MIEEIDAGDAGFVANRKKIYKTTYMIPQYRLFYSWQSDNKDAKCVIRKALDTVMKQLKGNHIAIEIIEGGGGEGFISIEDAVRMKIQRCDIFVGDVTPVGNVVMKGKLLPNANVMYEMGIATECLTADRIIAVAMAGDWKVENMPFDFNHYSMVWFKGESDIKALTERIKDRIRKTDIISRRINNRFFSNRLLNRNIQSGKYLPDTFLENRNAKEKARIFSAPYKMYEYLFEKIGRMSFAVYNKKRRRRGQDEFKLDISRWGIKGKAIDIDKLQENTKGLLCYLRPNMTEMDKDGNHGWATSLKVKRLAEKVELLNKKILVVTSKAGQGKTNFVCDLMNNLFIKEGIPYIFVNAYELTAEQPATCIAHEYNYIGGGSLENTVIKAERYCQQNLQYLIIVIDGLNENVYQRFFRNNLVRMLGALMDYHHVKVIMTCRKAFYDQNYTALQETFKEQITEVSLDERTRSDDRMEQNEEDCIIERYATHFGTKGQLQPSVRNELLENLLLMRIFFETYNGQDVSNHDFIDRVDLYERYYEILCNQIQKVIEQDSRATNVNHITSTIFQHIIEWMIDHDCFNNIPYDDIIKALPHHEAQSFESFLNSNLIIRHDPTGVSGRNSDVINFTFEEMRDFLTINYLLDYVYHKDSKKFWKLVGHYTDSQNNQAEGIRRFLFLYARNKGKQDLWDEIKREDWYEETFNYYIWDVKEERLTEEDVSLVKKLIVSNSRDTIRYLSYYHWSPKRHPKLNLNTLFEVLNELEPIQQKAILEKAWKYKNGRRNLWGGPDITERSDFLRVLEKGIKRRKDDKDPVERRILDQFSRYLVETTDRTVYVPAVSDESEVNPYVISGYDFYRYLMTVHKGTKEDFLKEAGAKKGFSKQMFGEIYDAIFMESEDVEQMYHSFYQKEYPDLAQFISMHYCIPRNEVKLYMDALATGKYRIVDFSSIDYGSSSFENLFSSDDMFERMYNWLNWRDDEDKN